MIDSTEREIITEVTRDLVRQLSPEEEPLFSLTSQMFFERSGKLDEDWGEKLLGYDHPSETVKEAVFLTPVLLSIMTDVVSFIKHELGKSIQGGGSLIFSGLVKKMFKRFQPAGEQTETRPPVSLTPEQLAALHHLVIEKATELRLSQNRAASLADKIVACLVMDQF